MTAAPGALCTRAVLQCAFVAALFTALAAAPTHVAAGAGECIALPATRTDGSALFCSAVVTWLVPMNWSVTVEDQSAAGNAQANACPYYRTAEYQCGRHFPQCNNATGDVQRLCRSTCLAAETANGGECNPNRFASDFFTNECDNTAYISSGSDCHALAVPEHVSDASTWKWVLVGILCAVGGAIILSFAWSRIRACLFARTLAKEDEEDRAHNRDVRDRAERPTPQPDPESLALAAVGGQVGATVAEMPPLDDRA